MVGEHDTRLWRVVHHYVAQGRARIDASDVTQIAIDETAARRGHDYITLFVDIDQARVLFVTEGRDANTIAAFANDDRHAGDHGHEQRLKQQGEATVWPRPRHADRFDTARIAADARHAGVEIGLMLKEAEMAPGLSLGVVGLAVRRAADRAGKSAARGKVDLDVQSVCLGAEVGVGHRPRRGQS
jgi:hypothetical protein